MSGKDITCEPVGHGVLPARSSVRRGSLGESERQFRLLVQGVTDYAIYMLDIDGQVASWNAGGERIKGYRGEEIIGRHFSCFYTPEDFANGEPELALATARAEGKYEKEGWRVRKDGSRFWANVVIDPVHDDDGVLVGFAKITRDVTQRQQQAQALEVAQRAMLQAHRMEAIGQLTFGVAHDFNNLLTVITNSLDLIAVESDPQRIRRLVAVAQRAGERGSLLTRQLLAFSRRQTLNPESSDLNALLYATESVLRRAVGDHVQIEFDLARGLGLVDVDIGEFEAAMLNLMVNARDAMPEGGQVVVRTREHDIPDDPAPGAGLEKPGKYICVSVEDTGTGMSEEVRARATEPFFTTKDVGRGSGLGLSQVYGFAVQSGGHVSIDSAVGHGTVVRFYLPVRDDGSKSLESSDAPTKILLVEDDPDVQLVTVEALRYMGFAVLTADEGAAGLEIIERDDEIGILLTDVVMPKGMSGVDLLEKARAIRPGLKVLLVSGYARGQLPPLPQGCDFLAKPYRVEQLEARLRRFTAELAE